MRHRNILLQSRRPQLHHSLRFLRAKYYFNRLMKWEPADELTNESTRRKMTILAKSVRMGLMRIKFWGVRGSTPTPQPENLRYGGNTSCVEVRFGDSLFIFDCGTGFRSLGQQLRREFDSRTISARIFVSHFHWDHIQGIPFFGPLYDKPENHFIF